MLVVKINELTKKRAEIVLENGFSFVLYKGELRLYKISENENLSDEAYNEIINRILPLRAKKRAMNLLKVRPYTVKGLTDKLNEGGYPAESVKIAIDYVASYHYLDDRAYAAEYIETYKDRKSRTKLRYDLIRKGIDKNLADEVLKDIFSDEGNEFEKEQILNFIKKKNYDSANATYADRMKLLAALYRKGYSMELVNKLLDITTDNL